MRTRVRIETRSTNTGSFFRRKSNAAKEGTVEGKTSVEQFVAELGRI